MAYFPHFWDQKCFFQKIQSSVKTPNGSLDTAEFQKKLKSQFKENLFRERQTLFIWPFWLWWLGQGSSEKINQLRDTAVDNKNKIQINSAYNIYLTNLEILCCKITHI